MRKQTAASFMPEMVKAILDDRKTMTRRKIKSRHESGLFAVNRRVTDGQVISINSLDWDERNCEKDITCPYGKPGDLLYVREAHYMYGHWEPVEGVKTKGGKQKWKFVQDTKDVLFELTPTKQFRKGRHHKDPNTPAWHKRLARFMPKSAARIWLEVTNVRVERLREINPNDACDEGVEYWNIDGDALEGGELQADFKNYTWTEKKEDDPNYEDRYFPTFANPVDSFRTLWQSINGPESWEANPWVWVVEFKILSTTGKPSDI
jgi:hypothetical protein